MLILFFLFFNPAFSDIDDRSQVFEQDGYFKGLKYVDRKGVHTYEIPLSKINGSFNFKFGILRPNFNTKYNFETIYYHNRNALALIDYERKLFRKLGHLSLILGSGLMFSQGNGRFSPDSVNYDPNQIDNAREKYFLFTIPLNAGVLYKVQFFDPQLIIPYAHAGGALFNMLEIRNDGARPSLLVVPSIYYAGGLKVLLDFFSSKRNTNTLEKEYGVNHTFLLFEIRQYLSITATANMTNTLFLGGFGIIY